ncbi:hypothetical protein BGW80DRAFT_1248985 [Lactifluus volemus]|nr:hypothetical protein BGW80DRAFT_1248985 [Lactifluus volemus]
MGRVGLLGVVLGAATGCPFFNSRVGRSDCPTTTPTSVNCIALISESIAMSVRSSTSPVLRSNTVTAKDAGERVLTGKRSKSNLIKKGMSVKGVLKHCMKSMDTGGAVGGPNPDWGPGPSKSKSPNSAPKSRIPPYQEKISQCPRMHEIYVG